jgi:3-deoxy-7-phosphoheptulonate synthase
MKNNINSLRKNIDSIDEKIIYLINERKKISSELISSKLNNSRKVFDEERENEIIEQLKNYNNENDFGINTILIEKLFRLIFDDSKRTFYKDENLQTINENISRYPLMIAGPCAVENNLQINQIATALASIGVKFLRGGTFKPRTSPSSFQGLGDEGVKLLFNAAKQNNMYSVTEILEAEQFERNQEFIDVIQIGSRSMTSYGLLKSIGKLTANANKHSSKFVILKRGFSATISEFLNAADYILQAGNPNVILCLRGIRTFEQINSSLRFTPDLAGILELKTLTNIPIIFDPSHSTGDSKYVVPISNAALQIGADGLMIETHCEPEKSIVDAEQSISPNELLKIIHL